MLKTRTDLIKKHYGDKFEELKDYIDRENGYCTAKHTGQINGVKFLLEEQEPVPPLYWKWIPNNGLAKALENNGWKPISEFVFPPKGKDAWFEIISPNNTHYCLKIWSDYPKSMLSKIAVVFKEIKLSEPPNFYSND